MITIAGFTITYQTLALIAGIWGCAVGLLVLYIRKPKTQEITNRLQGLEETEKYFIEHYKYKTKYGRFYGKYLKSAFDNPNSIFYKISEELKVNPYELERKLKLVKSDLTVEEYISIKILGLMLGGFITFIGTIKSFTVLYVGIAVLMFSIFLDKILLDDKLKKREKIIERELPNFLDLLYSACAAGHTITEAIQKVSTKYAGICAEEFNAAMVETKGNGGDFRRAMENMMERNNVEALSNVVSDILISYDKGDEKIIETLKNEAEQMREIVNANIEEIANRKSSTLVIPMIFFSFGPLFAFMLIPLFAQFKAVM